MKITLFFISIILIALWSGCSSVSLNTQLVQAAEKGDTPEVERLLESGADIESTDSAGWTPYLAASVNGHLTTLKFLEKAGAKTILDLE
jgi:ankyrin repeat protein